MRRKISQLPLASGLSDENLLEIVRYAQSQKLTALQLRKYVEQGLGTAAFAQSVGAVTNGAIMERGDNDRGSYIKFADGTMFTWGIQTLPAECPPGQGVVWDVTRQPEPFVGQAQHSISICFFSENNGGGRPLYTTIQTYGTEYGSMISAALNTGQTPNHMHPSFTIGTLVAKSYRVYYQSSGRWM